MRFGHMSDTHLPGHPPNAFLERVCREVQNPWETLQACLEELAAENVDFVLHAGDIVHEGCDADYARVQQLFETCLPGVPVIFAPGNHDGRGVFWKGLPGLCDLGGGQFVQDVRLDCGVRVLVLDTLRKAAADPISERQLDWLEARLAEPTADVTLLLMHHPPVWQDPIFAVPASERLTRMIADSAVKGIFAGHTHQNLSAHFAGKPLYVADSMAVGMKSKKGAVQYHSRTGYNICGIDKEGQISVENRLMSPQIHWIRK